MLKRYECIKGFSVEQYDENGFSTEKYVSVGKGTKWEDDEEDYRFIDGEVRLQNEDDLTWLELTHETVSKYFKETV